VEDILAFSERQINEVLWFGCVKGSMVGKSIALMVGV